MTETSEPTKKPRKPMKPKEVPQDMTESFQRHEIVEPDENRRLLRPAEWIAELLENQQN